MTKNDNKILDLRQKIEEKKKSLGKAVRFNPITNCSIELYGTRHNLHTLGKNDLQLLLVHLNALEMSAGDLEIDTDSLSMNGYTLSAWIEDVKSKLDYLNHKAENDRLQKMEEQLARLLSQEKQTELAIEEIASSL